MNKNKQNSRIGNTLTSVESFEKNDIRKLLRMSITDFCNYRCFFCHNEGQGAINSTGSEMTIGEIKSIINIAYKAGIRRIKFTGGEPLLYSNSGSDIIDLLNECKRGNANKNLDLSIITNGYLLTNYLKKLKEAGLKRVTVSIPTLNKNLMKRYVKPDASNYDIKRVLNGVDSAIRAGMNPVKVNFTLFYSIQRDEGNFYEIGNIVDKCIELGVTELRFHTLLWHNNFEKFDDYYIYWTKEILEKLKAQFSAVIRRNPFFKEFFEKDLLLYSDKAFKIMYPRTRKFYTFSGPLSIVFEPMKLNRFSNSPYCINCEHQSKCQEGAYSLRISANGIISGCLLGNENIDFLKLIREGASEKYLLKIFEEAFRLLPQ